MLGRVIGPPAVVRGPEEDSLVINVVTPGRVSAVEARGDRPKDELWVGRAELREATGWELKPEGLCKDDRCIPLASADPDSLVDGDSVHVSALWERVGRPVLRADDGRTWMLGCAAAELGAALESLEAPDFELPDIDGRLHRLSDQHGKKVLLVTWASW